MNSPLRRFFLSGLFLSAFSFLLLSLAGEKERIGSPGVGEQISFPSATLAWTSTHGKSSAENAFAHFEKHGREFGALTVDEYVRQAVLFVQTPPAGTLTTRQKDGDTVFFHPASGTFAVKTPQGRIRTFFIRAENLKGYKSNRAYFNEQAGRR